MVDLFAPVCLIYGECVWHYNQQINLRVDNYIKILTFTKFEIYGAAVTFFELLPEEQLTEERKKALKLDDDQVSIAVTLRGFY